MKNFFLVLSHYNFIQIKVKTKKSMTLQPFNIRGWKWLSAYDKIILTFRYLTFLGSYDSPDSTSILLSYLVVK